MQSTFLIKRVMTGVLLCSEAKGKNKIHAINLPHTKNFNHDCTPPWERMSE